MRSIKTFNMRIVRQQLEFSHVVNYRDGLRGRFALAISFRLRRSKQLPRQRYFIPHKHNKAQSLRQRNTLNCAQGKEIL